jgi:hypothetical protein
VRNPSTTAIFAACILMFPSFAAAQTAASPPPPPPAAMMSPVPAKQPVMPAASSALEATAQQAYVYGFPMVDFYRIMYGYFIDAKGPAYKTPFNTLFNTDNVYTPADTTVQTPNSDTPYSFVGLDLRAEPYVLTMPPIAQNRYYSIQFIDQYTFNVGYAGSRTTGNNGTKVLVAGPGWKGAVPAGITTVVHFGSAFGLALIRTQLFGTSDLPAVQKIQAGYSAVPLSTYLHAPKPPAPPAVMWPVPLSPADERTSPAFFDRLAFILQFCPVDPSETALRAEFANIGIVPGKPFVASAPASAYTDGMVAGQKQIDAKRAATASANDLFGTRAQMHNDFLLRAVGAQYGILGNSADEAIYLGWDKTATGAPLDGTKPATIHFAKGQLPPVKAFWSVTMYDLPQQLLVANSLKRYLLNSPMLPSMKKDPDGGLTLYVQHATPDAAKEANWLPAPAGPYLLVLRMYWPNRQAIAAGWKQPPITVTR